MFHVHSLSKAEEKRFKLTNAFTSAEEGSVLDISNRYRHLQHNKRPAAVREMKKVCKIDFKEHICSQIMVCSWIYEVFGGISMCGLMGMHPSNSKYIQQRCKANM